MSEIDEIYIENKYLGDKLHGYWWVDYDKTIKYSKNLFGADPVDFFSYATHVKWWKVDCELDWYRMIKELKKSFKMTEIVGITGVKGRVY